MDLKFHCEFCGKPIPFDDYIQLSKNSRYDDDDVYITHRKCKDPNGEDVLEEIEICGELMLVRSDESGE